MRKLLQNSTITKLAMERKEHPNKHQISIQKPIQLS